jgi:N-acetylglutamate synthase
LSSIPGDRDLIRLIEECSFNAWPPNQTLLCDGWVLRLNGGYTKRANSANAWQHGPDFSSVVQTAETLYRGHGLPVVFRLTPLAAPACDAALEQAGYGLADPSLVMIKKLDAPSAGAPGLTILLRPDQAWAEGAFQANGIAERFRPARQSLLASIAKPTAFATMRDGNGHPVAFGLAVVERGQVGLFDIVARPEARGKGFGHQLVAGLLAWGASAGAHQAYLQVGADNIRARTLYERMGFAAAYDYHYRVL